MKSFLLPFGFVRLAFVVTGLAVSLHASTIMADLVVVVSAKNSVSGLTQSEIADIFLGKTSRFPDGGPVVAIDLVEGSGERDEFYARFADKSAAQMKAHWSRIIFTGRGLPPKQVSNDAAVKEFLRKNPNAIGYIERERVDNNVKMLVVR